MSSPRVSCGGMLHPQPPLLMLFALYGLCYPYRATADSKADSHRSSFCSELINIKIWGQSWSVLERDVIMDHPGPVPFFRSLTSSQSDHSEPVAVGRFAFWTSRRSCWALCPCRRKAAVVLLHPQGWSSVGSPWAKHQAMGSCRRTHLAIRAPWVIRKALEKLIGLQ